MTVVAAHLYRKGEPAEPVSPGAPPPAMGKRDFVWIGLHEPSEAELLALQKNYDLHPLAVDDGLHGHELPKVDVFGDQLFVVARTAHLEDDAIRYGETAIFVGDHHIITVRHGSGRAHSALRAHLEAAPGLLRHGPDYVLYAILDFIVDGYQPIVEAIEEDVLAMEASALDAFLDRPQIARLLRLRGELLRFRRSIAPMSDVAGRLVHLDLRCLDREVRPYFQDVNDHVRRIDMMVGNLQDALTSVFEVSHLMESLRQGETTRRLAAWAAILAVPTAIAGVYGMNFEHMPELQTKYGYFVVLAVMATLCATLYAGFKRAKWL